jgi:ABC-type branched-subunit amino acid transport system substrate-binding protein
LFASYIKDGVTIVREARGLGFSIPLLGSSTANTPEFTTKVGSVADGLVLADLYDSSSEEFRGRWQRAFSSPYPGIQSGAPLFYDIAKLLAEYLTSHDAQQLSEYLNSVDYIGASGAIRFNAEGNLDRKHVLHRLNQGKFELLSSEQG